MFADWWKTLGHFERSHSFFRHLFSEMFLQFHCVSVFFLLLWHYSQLTVQHLCQHTVCTAGTWYAQYPQRWQWRLSQAFSRNIFKSVQVFVHLSELFLHVAVSPIFPSFQVHSRLTRFIPKVAPGQWLKMCNELNQDSLGSRRFGGPRFTWALLECLYQSKQMKALKKA